MDTTPQWTQEFGVAKPMASEMGGTTSSCTRANMERKVRPQKEQALNCPRCHSTNTKFCYYNNYSLTQPRYFCKTCRRYWTEGGTLRNVPVGGGSRKNKRYATTTPPPPPPPSLAMINKHLPDLNPKMHDQAGHDLNLGFQDYHHQGGPPHFDIMHGSSSANSSSSSALNFLTARGFNSFIPMAQSGSEGNGIFGSGFPFQECKTGVSYPGDDVSRYGNPSLGEENMNVNGSNLMFALGKRNLSSNEGDQDHKGNVNGFWNGMLGGGSW